MANFTSLPISIYPTDKIVMKSGSETTLLQLFRPKFQKIKNDVAKLHSRKILLSPHIDYFVICRFESLVYLYHHSGYMAFSNVRFNMIANCANDIKEDIVDEQPCDHEHHDHLLQYYNGNQKLKFCYSRIITDHEGSDRASAAKVNLDKLNNYVQ